MRSPSSIRASEAERPLVLALDVGSSSVRVALHDARGRLVEGTLVRSRYRWATSDGGDVRTDAGALLDRVDRLLDRLVAETDAAVLGDVAVAGMSTLYHSFVGVDAARRPVTPLLSWADTSAAPEARQLAAALDAEHIRQLTGAPLHAAYWPARIRRFSANRPAGWSGWAGLPELLLERLTGCWTLGLSLASGTGLVDRASARWSALLLDTLSVDETRLPPISTSIAPVGRLRSAAAGRWPALAHVEWLAPVGDGTCGNIGLGCIGADRAALMIGTSAALRVLVDLGPPEIPAGLFAYPAETGHTLFGGALSEGGGVAAWWSRLVDRSLDDLTRDAANRAGGELTVLPYLTGERGPGYHGAARGVIAGLDRADDAASVFRALLESVALGLAELDTRLSAALTDPPSITASGGGVTRSRLWQQILADALGRPIAVGGGSEPSLRGAALLALASIGEVPLGTADGPTTSVVDPDPNGRVRLQEAAERRRELYRDLFS